MYCECEEMDAMIKILVFLLKWLEQGVPSLIFFEQGNGVLVENARRKYLADSKRSVAHNGMVEWDIRQNVM